MQPGPEGAAVADWLNEPPGDWTPDEGDPAGSGSEADFPERPDLPGAVEPSPLPIDARPPSLRGWSESVARSVQVSPDMPALLSLTAVSAAVGGKVVARVDGAWDKEWIVLHAVLVALSGERKSPVFRHMIQEIQAWEEEQAAAIAPRRRAALELLDVAERKLKRQKDAAASQKATLEEVEAALLEVEEARQQVPQIPSLLAQDATPEALVQQMSEQGGRVAVLSPEGGPIQIIAGRYSDGAARLEELTQGYDGEEIKPKRISREAQPVRRPALTLGVALQPSVLETIRNGRSLRGQGVWARISWVRPRSRIGQRVDSSEAPPLDQAAGRLYGRTLRRLLDWAPADVEMDGTPVPHVLTLSPEAQEVKKAYHDEIEPQLAAGGDLAGIPDWAKKAVGRAIRLSVLLELSARAGDGRPLVGEPISRWAMESAVRICRSLTSHALAVYGEMEADRRVADLRYLLRRLQELPEETSETELRRAAQGRKSVEGAEQVADLVDELEARGCVRRVELPPTGGRPRSPLLRLHPVLRKHSAESAESSPEGMEGLLSRTFRNADAENEPKTDPLTTVLDDA